MVPRAHCLYCSAPSSSKEHVISEALGCKESIKEGVCRKCNGTFGYSFEANFINGLALFLNFFQIPNGQGVIPPVWLKGKIGTQEFKFRLTGDGRAELPPNLLSRGETERGHERKFRLFQKEQERLIGQSLHAKHPDLVWEQVREAQKRLVLDAQPEFDPLLVCSAQANRTVAKYAVNLLIRDYGYAWAKDKSRSLVSYVKGEPSATRVGVLGEPGLLTRLPLAPPKHLFIVVCDSRSRSVVVLLSFFCLLSFCVIAEEAGVLIDSMKSGALDPSTGSFTPLFLGGSPMMKHSNRLPQFPMPEFEFSERLRSSEIGTPKQAQAAALNAIKFMKAHSATTETPHICYNCGKVLPELTVNCKFCGKSPLPE